MAILRAVGDVLPCSRVGWQYRGLASIHWSKPSTAEI